MDAPPATLKFPQLVKDPPNGPSETLDLDSPDNQPAVVLPRTRMIANVTLITGAALMGDALVQTSYSGLAPMDASSAPAIYSLYSFVAVMLLNVLSLLL